MKKRIILFDADGTLWDFDASAKLSMQTNFARRGYDFSDAVFERYQEINHGLWEKYERGEMPRDRVLTERFDLLFAELGITEKGSVFAAEFREVLENNPIWMDGAVELLTRLRPDFGMYIVTNGVASTQHKRIARTGLDRYVDGFFISEEIGSQKPQKEFFDYALSHIGPCAREELLLVGDSLSADILGANRAGITSCWFNPANMPLSREARPDYEIHRLSELIDIL